MTRRNAQAGFTLLEFLVAFALLSAITSALLAAFAVAARGDHQAAFVTRATTLAKSKLAAIGVESPLQPGTLTGKFENGYPWRSDVRSDGVITSGGKQPIRAYWIEVTVFDPDAKGRRTVSLTAFEIDRGEAR